MKKWIVAVLSCFFPLGLIHSAPEPKPELVELLTPKLNSDRISSLFGSYGIDPLKIDTPFFGDARISNLYSLEKGKKVMRTLALVHFAQPVDILLKEVHAKISQGDSIGIALRDEGWSIDKVPLYFGTVALSPQIRAWMDETQEHSAAVHIYQLDVFRKGEDQRLSYCSIIETHSPQYLNEEWLKLLYPEQYQNFHERTPQVESLIALAEKCIQQFPYPEKDLQSTRDYPFGVSTPPSLSRSDPCLCDSGLKYKKCCLAENNVLSNL